MTQYFDLDMTTVILQHLWIDEYSIAFAFIKISLPKHSPEIR